MKCGNFSPKTNILCCCRKKIVMNQFVKVQDKNWNLILIKKYIGVTIKFHSMPVFSAVLFRVPHNYKVICIKFLPADVCLDPWNRHWWTCSFHISADRLAKAKYFGWVKVFLENVWRKICGTLYLTGWNAAQLDQLYLTMSLRWLLFIISFGDNYEVHHNDALKFTSVSDCWWHIKCCRQGVSWKHIFMSTRFPGGLFMAFLKN